MPKIGAKRSKKLISPPPPTVKCTKAGCPNRFVQTRKMAFGGHCSAACWASALTPFSKKRR